MSFFSTNPFVKPEKQFKGNVERFRFSIMITGFFIKATSKQPFIKIFHFQNITLFIFPHYSLQYQIAPFNIKLAQSVDFQPKPNQHSIIFNSLPPSPAPTMQRQYQNEPQPDPNYPPRPQDEDALPEPIKMFRYYIKMIRRDAQNKKKANQQREQILLDSKRKDQDLECMKRQMDDIKNEMQLQQRHNQEVPIPLKTWMSFNASIVFILGLIIVIITWNAAPLWPDMSMNSDMIMHDKSQCLYRHPDGWECLMDEEERPGRKQWVGKFQVILEDREIKPSDLFPGNRVKVKRCGDRNTDHYSEDASEKLYDENQAQKDEEDCERDAMHQNSEGLLEN